MVEGLIDHREQASKLCAMQQRLLALLAPPPDLSVSEWADSERYLSKEASSEVGKWRTERAPYLREIMDAVSDLDVEKVVVKSCAQVGKTEVLLNVIGYFVRHDPSPILLLQPTLDMAQAYSKDRLSPMFRDSPTLTGLLEDRSRDKSNTLLHKNYPGGQITLAGANSPSSLASRPIRIVLYDEVDKYPVSAGEAGDPIKLASRRADTFWNRKSVLASTPLLAGSSRIDEAYQRSSQGVWQLSCPECGERQQILHKHIKREWSGEDEGNPENLLDVKAACTSCGALSTEQAWKKAPGSWSHQQENQIKGFHLNAYVSPWRSWLDIEREAIIAAKAPQTWQTFVNEVLGEVYEDEGETLEVSELETRVEEYPAQVPAGGVVLTCGIDMQQDRLEAEVAAWGLGEESWNIDYRIIYGDPLKRDVWNQLDEFLRNTYQHETAATLGISMALLDTGNTGGYTQAAYDYLRRTRNPRLYGIKGKAGERPLLTPMAKQRAPNKRQRPLTMFVVGVDEAKRTIYSRLALEEVGAGYCHFPVNRTKSYFEQLGAEAQQVKLDRHGRPRREWVKKQDRNEALDCRVYAYAALKLLAPNLEQRAKQLNESKQEQEVEAVLPQKRKMTVMDRLMNQRRIKRLQY